MNRRAFLQQTATVAGWAMLHSTGLAAAGALAPEGQVITVSGPLPPEQLGLTLSHEHVLVDFIGADKIGPGRYTPEVAFAKILPHLKRVHELGCKAMVECTPAYLGRDPLLLKRLAAASGLHLLTNTGYYGAADNKFLPAHAHTETADQLARRWTREWANGIDDTGVKPGFIKIGVGGESLSPLHRKLVQAAARAHRATGLTIASHTGPAHLALEQLDTLRTEGVGPSAFVWVHAQAEANLDLCLEVAARGCWVSYDGFSPAETGRYLDLVSRFDKAGRLGQLLLSHDAGWFKPGEPDGGEFRPFTDLFESLLPQLRQLPLGEKREAGGETLVRQLMVQNPAHAFARRIRLA